jgi:hypothetical protein
MTFRTPVYMYACMHACVCVSECVWIERVCVCVCDVIFSAGAVETDTGKPCLARMHACMCV